MPVLHRCHKVGHQLQPVTQQRDLGSVLPTALSWTKNYNANSPKSLLLSPVLTEILFYLRMVRSHFTYCSEVWHPNLPQDITRLENPNVKPPSIYCKTGMNYAKIRLIVLKLLYHLRLFFVKLGYVGKLSNLPPSISSLPTRKLQIENPFTTSLSIIIIKFF